MYVHFVYLYFIKNLFTNKSKYFHININIFGFCEFVDHSFGAIGSKAKKKPHTM